MGSLWAQFRKYKVVILFPTITAVCIGADLLHTYRWKAEKRLAHQQ